LVTLMAYVYASSALNVELIIPDIFDIIKILLSTVVMTTVV